MGAEIIPNTGALLIKEGKEKLLVVADLHFNDEDEDVVNILVEELRTIVKKFKPKIIIVNGDIFNFGTGGVNVELFIQKITQFCSMQVLSGNHDPDPEIFPSFFLTKNYCITHGDFDYETGKKNLILGHTHPFLDGKPVFLKGELKDGRKFIVSPPFNKKVGGNDLVMKDLLVGFIFRKGMIKDCLAYDMQGKKLAEINFNKD